MHEDDLLFVDKDQVWFSRQSASTTTVFDLHSTNNAANNHFGPCSAGTDAPHNLTALIGIEYVHFPMA
jgi:hypothetical protein